MKYLITNLSSVSANVLHAVISARLDPLSPAERAKRFGSVMGEAANALALRAVVEFEAEKVWATFVDDDGAPAVVFSLAERANKKMPA